MTKRRNKPLVNSEMIDLLPPPIVDAVLNDIDGGETNLLPRSVLGAPLRVEIEMWQNSSPSPSDPETLILYWGGDEVESKTWTSDVLPQDLIFLVPVTFLQEGQFEIGYDVTLHTGQPTSAEPLTVTIDKTPPVLGSPSALIFPGEVVSDGVTADYLDNNGDQVLAGVPPYVEAKPGDVIEWYWDETLAENYLAGTKTLLLADVGKPILVPFGGDMIRARGDGQYHAHYRVTDRAGNISLASDTVTLPVDASPIPRHLPWPEVEDASGSGDTITLDPLRTTFDGATVIIPDTADIRPNESASVQWAQPGVTGAYTATAPTSPDGREYKVPKEYIAAHMGKTIPVHYNVTKTDGGVLQSQQRNLRMLTISQDRFPIIQCEERSGGTLPLSQVPEEGARLTLVRWVLMSTDQLITIRAGGLDLQGSPVEHTVLEAHRVTEQELADGIGQNGDVRIPKPFLNQLKRDFPFRIEVFVSFDLGDTWPPIPNFPRPELILTD